MEHDDSPSTSSTHGRGRVPRLATASVLAYATVPYAGFLAANIGDAVDHRRVAIYWAATSIAALLPVLLSALFEAPATARRLAVVTSGLLFLFFNYPMTKTLQDRLGVDPWYHPAGWALVTAVVVFALLFAGTRKPMQTTVAVFGLGMLAVPMGQLGVGLPTVLASAGAAAEALPVAGGGSSERMPNIYYFVPDGYAGLGVVERISGLDTDPFAAALAAHGLTVSPEARANYPTTYGSLSSTLDMRYLVEAGDVPDTGELLPRLQGQNRVVSELRGRGYRYVHAYPGAWRGSRCSGVEDLCLGDGGLGETDIALLELTPIEASERAARLPLKTLAESTDPRMAVERTFRLAEDGPVFLFMHLLTPHPPFMWNADCTVREGVEFDIAGWAPEDRSAYGASVACLNGRLLQAIDAILAADDDPVIIIQADHGSAFSFTWDLPAEAWLEDGGGRDRLSILSAIRLPRWCEHQEVPADLAPVNTFRIVLGCIDGTETELLPHRSYLIGYRGEPAELLEP